MITAEDAPEMLEAERVLGVSIWAAIGDEPITDSLLARVRELVIYHRIKTRQGGVDFPEFVVMCVPRLRMFRLGRRDANTGEIVKNTLFFLRQCRAEAGDYPSGEELRQAIRMAWPTCRLDDIFDEIKKRKADAIKMNEVRAKLGDLN